MRQFLNKYKKETHNSSLVKQWVSLVALVITVSFVIFSVIIYTIVSQQFLTQQKQITRGVITTFETRLGGIPNELTIANVVPALSPGTQKVLKGAPSENIQTGTETKKNRFNDDLLATLTNPDISVVVFDKQGNVVFANGNDSSTLPKIKNNYTEKLINASGQKNLMVYGQIHSIATEKITGYIVVTNKMSNYNKVLRRLRWSMIIISLFAIALLISITYLIVKRIVAPVNEMEKVASAVDKNPDSTVRIPDLHRDDELGRLAYSFNQMLDRVQSYIQQQKQFVGDVSHELRTPVAVIQGHLNLIKRWGKDDPKVLEESIDASLQETNRMEHLISEMLDLTRVEQVDVQYPDAKTNVNEVVKRVVSDLHLVHSDFKLQLNDTLPEHTEIKMFHNHFEQLLVILIDNAIKYSTDKKQVDISASLDNNFVVIKVKDYGEGISDKEKDKIFNRFYRVDKARTREKGGNGLGLSIAKQLVENYHGTISVSSKPNIGSTFELKFPLIK